MEVVICEHAHLQCHLNAVRGIVKSSAVWRLAAASMAPSSLDNFELWREDTQNTGRPSKRHASKCIEAIQSPGKRHNVNTDQALEKFTSAVRTLSGSKNISAFIICDNDCEYYSKGSATLRLSWVDGRMEGWSVTGLDGGVVERKWKHGEGRAEEQGGNAHTTNMLCACVHHGLYCLGAVTHKSQKSHQRQDYQFDQKKQWSKLEEFVVSEHEGAILCHCMFFF